MMISIKKLKNKGKMIFFGKIGFIQSLFIVFLFLIIIGCQNYVANDVTPDDLKNDEHGTEVLEIEVEEDQISEFVTYGDNFNGYLVRPNAEGKFPGVVLIHEWWGLNQNIKNMAHDLAEEGFVALAVDLYNGKVATESSDARKYATEVRNNMDSALSHMKSAVEFLRANEFVVSDSVGSMGWCFGGGMSMQLSLNDNLEATVIYYGNLETDKEALSRIDWPILGIFGEEDRSITVESVNEFVTSLDELGIENEIYIYEGVGHAFANPSNPGHDPESTEDAWMKTVSFLNKNLKNR